MSVYTRNQPIATDLLEISQPYLANNTNAADDFFGLNHYSFSSGTGQNGKHTNIQTPQLTGGHPTTPAGQPSLYAMQDSANIGVIQYSRGASDALPSPITTLQSPAAPITIAAGQSTPILNFAGINNYACGILTYSFLRNTGVPYNQAYFINWNGTSFENSPMITTVAFVNPGVGTPSSLLQLTSTLGCTRLFWTFQLLRIQP